MKKIILLGLLVFLFAVLPVTGQADELAGTWIGFAGPDEFLLQMTDFSIMRFSPPGGSLAVIDTDGKSYEEYSGTWNTDGERIVFDRSDGERIEIGFHFSDGKLILGWDERYERMWTRIDDSWFPTDPASSPYFGEDKQYMISQAADGGIKIFEYLGEEETVEVPETVFGLPVTEIDANSFTFHDEIKKIILPDGIRTIGESAFSSCYGLESIRLPKTLLSIGESAFLECSSLKEVVIPEGVKEIDTAAFVHCSFLRRAALPESIGSIGADAFYGDDSVKIYVKQGSFAEGYCQENELKYSALDDAGWAELISDDGTINAGSAVSGDTELAGTWIGFNEDDFYFFRFSPDGSMTILESNGYYPEVYKGSWDTNGETVFFTMFDGEYEERLPYFYSDGKLIIDWYWERECTRIDDSWFPESIAASPYLGEDKLYWISQLEDGTIQIDGYIGSEETVVVPDTVFGFPVTAIRETAFMGTDGLKHVVIPHGVTFIGRQAFANNIELETAELPDTLQTLEYSAFEYCGSLKEIVIPEGVTFLDSDTFWGCESLESVVLPESLEAIDENGAFDSRTQDAILFTVPKGSFAEQYCRDNELTCVTPDGELLTGGMTQGPDAYADDGPYGWEADDEIIAEPYNEPYEEVYSEPVYGDEELYNQAMAFYNDEKYFSARQAFLMSGYPDAEEWAEKCIQKWPSTGEVWHDRSQWLQDMELTIVVNQPEDTGMLIRIFKDKAPVSYLFLAGSDSVTVRLPGNGYYEIMDGVGYNWYGIKEAFGGEGRYETMTFDEAGTERVFLQSYYAYTLSINISEPTPGGEDVYSETIDYEKFVVSQ